ncbi:MAG: hypothetical protein JWO98_3085 [Frankiales bacterium]|nr:hypothetical protein [Frankiales bacterium]
MAVPLIAAGCAAGPPSDAPVAAADYASNTAPTAAQMICSKDVGGQIAVALNLGSAPAPQAAWANHVYTCTYTLPTGRLLLSVTVAPSDSAARGTLQAMRRQLATSKDERGFGQQAYASPTGALIAVKDNMVLRVDATGLPDELGATHQGRTQFAEVVAAGVFQCWSGA